MVEQRRTYIDSIRSLKCLSQAMGSAEISRGRGVERCSKYLEINGTSSICLYVETARLVILS